MISHAGSRGEIHHQKKIGQEGKFDRAKNLTERVKLIFGKSHRFVGQ